MLCLTKITTAFVLMSKTTANHSLANEEIFIWIDIHTTLSMFTCK